MNANLSDLADLFVDTDIFPTVEESEILRSFEPSGFRRLETGRKYTLTTRGGMLFKLAKKGLVEIFPCHDCIYFLLKRHPASRPVTIEFKSYFAKLARDSDGELTYINEEEKDKVAFSRGFISQWVYLKNPIPDETYREFLKIFTNRAFFTISIPSFLMDQFQEEIDKTGMEYQVLTPEYHKIKCPFCKHNFESKETNEIIQCPNCGDSILSR